MSNEKNKIIKTEMANRDIFSLGEILLKSIFELKTFLKRSSIKNPDIEIALIRIHIVKIIGNKKKIHPFWNTSTRINKKIAVYSK